MTTDQKQARHHIAELLKLAKKMEGQFFCVFGDVYDKPGNNNVAAHGKLGEVAVLIANSAIHKPDLERLLELVQGEIEVRHQNNLNQ